MLTQEQILEILKKVYDPEIPLNIVDLGLIYGVDIEDQNVTVRMTLTGRGCPMASMLANVVKRKIQAIEGVKDVEVRIVWDPPWTPDRLSEEAKKMLGA